MNNENDKRCYRFVLANNRDEYKMTPAEYDCIIQGHVDIELAFIVKDNGTRIPFRGDQYRFIDKRNIKVSMLEFDNLKEQVAEIARKGVTTHYVEPCGVSPNFALVFSIASLLLSIIISIIIKGFQ